MKRTKLKEKQKTTVYSIPGLTESSPPFRCRILWRNDGETGELAVTDSEGVVPVRFGLVSNVDRHEESVPGKSGKRKAV